MYRNLKRIDHGDGTITVTGPCAAVFADHNFELRVPSSAIAAWDRGALVQNAFSMLGAPQRELFISGICPECWARIFKQPERED
jgi:hypothetical protein